MSTGAAHPWLPELRAVDLGHVAVSAGVSPDGRLQPVGGLMEKIVACLLTKQAELDGVAVLVVASAQTGVPHLDAAKDHVFLPVPGAHAHESEAAAMRPPRSLLVLRAGTVEEAVRRLHRLQAATALSLVRHPLIVIESFWTGNWAFPLGAAAAAGASWYQLGPWAATLALLLWGLGVPLLGVVLPWRRPGPVMRLPSETRRPVAAWRGMLAVAGQPAGKSRLWAAWTARWLDGRLASVEASADPVTLSALPRRWRCRWAYRVRLLPAMLLVLATAGLHTSLQHALAEWLPPWGASMILGGAAQIQGAEGDEWAPVGAMAGQLAGARCATASRVLGTRVGSAGMIRVVTADKAHTARSLIVHVCDPQEKPLAYVGVRLDKRSEVMVRAPVRAGVTEILYRLEPGVWEIWLEVELLDHWGRVLDRVALRGLMEPVSHPRELWREGR